MLLYIIGVLLVIAINVFCEVRSYKKSIRENYAYSYTLGDLFIALGLSMFSWAWICVRLIILSEDIILKLKLFRWKIFNKEKEPNLEW